MAMEKTNDYALTAEFEKNVRERKPIESKTIGNGRLVKLHDKYNFIGSNKKLVSRRTWFDSIVVFENGYIIGVMQNYKVLFNSKAGELVINTVNGKSLLLDYIDPSFVEGLLRVKKANGGWDYINVDGITILPDDKRFIEATPFEDGKAKVKQSNGNVYVINRKGEVIQGNQLYGDNEEEGEDLDDEMVENIVNEVFKRIKKNLLK